MSSLFLVDDDKVASAAVKVMTRISSFAICVAVLLSSQVWGVPFMV